MNEVNRAGSAERKQPSICLLALPESSSAVLYGLYEVLSTFGQAWSVLKPDDPIAARFEVTLVSETDEPFRCHGGAPVATQAIVAEVDRTDIVIVTDLAIDPTQDHRGRWPGVSAWLRELHARGAVVCSVCSGSVLLAAAGLLEGLPATTHWGYTDHFRRFFPAVDLQPNRILLPTGSDHSIVTAGGMSAWEDLALYLLGRFHGEAVAVRAARLFLFGDHSEGQLLYAARLNPRRHEDATIACAQAWLAEHYAARDCLVRMIADSGLSERTFKRRFRKATGMSPLEYVQTMRIEEAKQMLESSSDAIDTIVEQIGYDDPASFRRLFKRQTGVTPGRYRQRYREITDFAR